MQMRITELLCVISVAGIVLSMLFQPTELNASIVVSSTLLISLAAIAMAIGRQSAARSFWLGFALTAIGYLVFSGAANSSEPRTLGVDFANQSLLLIFEKFHGQQITPRDGGGYGGGQSTDNLDDLFGQKAASSEAQIYLCQLGTRRGRRGDGDGYGGDGGYGGYGGEGGGYGSGGYGYSGGGGSGNANPYTQTNFLRIGHCAWALLLAWLIGHLSQFIYLRSNRQAQVDAPNHGG